MKMLLLDVYNNEVKVVEANGLEDYYKYIGCSVIDIVRRKILKVEDEINGITISYVAPTSRETFDSKKFKADNPDMYDEYVKLTPVKSSIRIKLD